MKDTQLLKGILEGCVLAIIAKGETYGYDILVQLEQYGFEDVLEGTLYPVLTRLSKKDYISCHMVKSPFGPMRKNYLITVEGKEWLSEFKENYKKITEQADQILFQGERSEKDEKEY